MFFRKEKLKRKFDDSLVTTIKKTKEDWQQAKLIEELSDDFNLEVIAIRKAAESVHFYLFKEARIRKVLIK